jgi:predicted ATPase
MAVYHVTGESGAQSRFEVALRTGLPSLIGREDEVGLLQERWERAQRGAGQVVLLRGEPGIGKSRLVQALKEQIGHAQAIRIEFRCSPYHQNTAFYPLIEHLQRALQFQREDMPHTKVTQLHQALSRYHFPQADTLPLLAALLALPHPEGHPQLALSPPKQREKTQEALVAWLREEAERQAVCCVWEDLHWVDPSSLDVLTLFLEQVSTTRLLAVLTFRPDFTPPWQPRAPISELTLNRLGRPHVEALIEQVTGGKGLPAEVRQQIVAKTDGVPLFVEELTKMVLESGLLRAADRHYELTAPLPSLAIPSTLQDSLMARLDRLAPVKEIAQVGATLGREFSYDVLHAVSPVAETALQQGLRQLVAAELLYERGALPQATYLFKHVLIQEAAYQSLLKSTRQQLHRQVARVLEEQFPARAAAEPEVLARHYEESGLAELAVPYYRRAGEQAAARSAHQEAIVHLRKAIALLTTLPESTARNTREISLQLALGPSLMAARGYALPETQAVWERARVLCDDVGDVSQLAGALVALSFFYSTGGAFARGAELAKRVLENAREKGEEHQVLIAHVGIAFAEYFQGKFTSALQHCEQWLASYDQSRHGTLVSPIGVDPGVVAQIFAGTSLWQLGYPDKALQYAREAVALARTRVHPFSLAFALTWEAAIHCFRRDLAAVRDTAAEVIPLSEAQGFPLWLGAGRVLHRVALAIAAADATAIPEIMQGMALAASTGNRSGAQFLILLLAELHAAAGNQAEALRAVEMALAEAEQTGQHSWDAELHRLQGQLTLQCPTPSTQAEVEAEHLFCRALEIARGRDARSHELRTATSLARLWQQQGKAANARALLVPIYGWFTEGFDTADLQEAKALLDALA